MLSVVSTHWRLDGLLERALATEVDLESNPGSAAHKLCEFGQVI